MEILSEIYYDLGFLWKETVNYCWNSSYWKREISGYVGMKPYQFGAPVIWTCD